MDDSDKGDDLGASGSGSAPSAQRPIGGMVVDPRDIRTNPTLTRFLRERISAGIIAGLTAIGVLRPRTATGELGPRSWKGLAAFLGTIFAIVFVWTSIHIVQPGTVAVPVTFGHPGKPLKSGLHITLPFTTTYSMSTRTQNYTMSSLKGEGQKANVDDSVAVLGKDGGAASVNATVLYRLDPAKATNVYRNLGRNYQTAIVRPAARFCIRFEFTRFGVVDDATTQLGVVQSNVASCMKDKLESEGLLLQDFQLREVALDPALGVAVGNKVAAQQKLQQQLFDQATAQKQADIARIQALATNDAARIAECGGQVTTSGAGIQTIIPIPRNQCSATQLTPEFLEFTYIQTLQQIAASKNTTTLVLPFDKNLTPLLSLPTGSSGSGSTTTTP